jgi:hypothetical protein
MITRLNRDSTQKSLGGLDYQAPGTPSHLRVERMESAPLAELRVPMTKRPQTGLLQNRSLWNEVFSTS